MTTQQLIIPDRIRVGFQNRQGTYTGKLAYVIYIDQKGVLRKEKSWQAWRDQKIEPVEFDNKPISGFVLNKKVGGVKESYSWNARNEYVRVYDPRDFEFEISIPNLLFILRECDCSRGKGLEGKFVYAWDGTELVLLPEKCEDFKKSKDYTNLQTQSVKAKELIPGAVYVTKKQKTLTYLGRLNYFSQVGKLYDSQYEDKDTSGVMQRYVFVDSEDKFVYLKELKQLAKLQSDTVVPNFAELIERYNQSAHGSRAVELYLKEAVEENPLSPEEQRCRGSEPWFYEDTDGKFCSCLTAFRNEYLAPVPPVAVSFRLSNKFWIEDSVLIIEPRDAIAIGPNANEGEQYNLRGPGYWDYGARNYSSRYPQIPWREPTTHRLFAKLESGVEFRVNSYTFAKER